MKRVRYTKYTGDPASDMSLEDLLKALSEYLLDSGFSDPFSRFAELDGEHTMENLREALRQALEAGDLFDEQMQQRIDQMAENGELDQLIEQLIERMERENYISVENGQDPYATIDNRRPGRRPAGRGAIRGHRQGPRFSRLQNPARPAGLARQIVLRPA